LKFIPANRSTKSENGPVPETVPAEKTWLLVEHEEGRGVWINMAANERNRELQVSFEAEQAKNEVLHQRLIRGLSIGCGTFLACGIGGALLYATTQHP
jgi:predicted neuraminidase